MDSLHGPPSPSDHMSGLRMVQKEEDGTRRTGWGGGIWGARVIEVVVGPGREQLGPTFTASSPPGAGL